jgi:hypothetical protein
MGDAGVHGDREVSRFTSAALPKIGCGDVRRKELPLVGEDTVFFAIFPRKRFD